MIKERRWVDEIDTASTLSQASALLQKSCCPLYVFLSSEYSLASIIEFLEEARKSGPGKQASYLLVLLNDEIKTEEMARYMVVGFHSFLCEPYSLAKLKSAIQLADRVRADGSQARLQTAANIMLASVMHRTAPKDYQSIWDDGHLNVACKVSQMYDYLRHVSGQSLRTPIVKELEPLSPLQRMRRFADLLGNLGAALRADRACAKGGGKI